MDYPVDVVTGILEPYQSVDNPGDFWCKQRRISGKTMVVILLDPVAADPAGSKASSRNRPSLEEIHLMFPISSSVETRMDKPPHNADLH